MTTKTHEADVSPRARFSSWWRMVGVIVELELRQRLRTTRWKATLVVAFVVTSLAVFGSMYLAVGAFGGTYAGWASNLYGLLIGFLVLLGIIVAPTLAATTINGDRKDATLAVVQDTAISNWQLALGKLIGSWVAGMALVAVAAPYVIWGLVEAPQPIWRGVVGAVVLALVFACYAGIGLGFSAVTARPAGSAVLTQAAVFFLLLGLPVVFGLLYPTVAQTHSVVRTDTTATDPSSPTPHLDVSRGHPRRGIPPPRPHLVAPRPEPVLHRGRRRLLAAAEPDEDLRQHGSPGDRTDSVGSPGGSVHRPADMCRHLLRLQRRERPHRPSRP